MKALLSQRGFKRQGRSSRLEGELQDVQCKLTMNRVDLTLKLYPGVPHAFYVWPELPQSRDYLETIVRWIGKFQK